MSVTLRLNTEMFIRVVPVKMSKLQTYVQAGKVFYVSMGGSGVWVEISFIGDEAFYGWGGYTIGHIIKSGHSNIATALDRTLYFEEVVLIPKPGAPRKRKAEIPATPKKK